MKSDARENDDAGGRLLTYRQVADRFQVSERTVFGLAKAGKLRCVKIGSSVRFSPAECSPVC